MANKYDKYFSKDMTKYEAMTAFFNLCLENPKSEKEQIKAAYFPISDFICERDLKYAYENNLMTS